MEPEDLIEDILEGENDERDEENETRPNAMSEDKIENIVSMAVQDAVDFIESEVSEDRIKAQKYFDGDTNLEYEAGRSRVVATKVRDTVRGIKPSLMRIFLSTSRPVEYIPRGPEDVAAAEQATNFVHYKFQEKNGYRLLSDVFHDALIKKMGIAKAYYDEKATTKHDTFTGLDDMQFQSLVADPDIEVLEHTETVEINEMGVEMVLHDLKIARTEYAGDICMESIPPEEFFFDRNARSIDDCYVCGQRSDMRVGDLVAMGFEFDDVAGLDSSTDSDTVTQSEEEQRRGYSVNPDEDENAEDPSMKKVMVTEAYMRIDTEGDGNPVLHRIIMGGSGYKLLDAEPCDEIPYAIFEIDPEPHTMLGRSIADITMNDQDVSTSVLRGILDNVALTNNPRLEVDENIVDMEDVLNNEIGAIIRTKGPGGITPVAVPFAAGQTLSILTYMDQLVEQKTGVTRASMGLDPDALQSTAKAAVSATVQAAAGQVEVMARNLAEGGMRRLFSLILRLVVKHADGEEMMRLTGEYTPVDPRAWDATMDLSVNVGLGTGREEEKSAAYREMLGLQMQIWQTYGPTNGVVSLTNIRNTLSDMAASAGIRNSERYFAPMTQEKEQMLMQQQAQAAQMQPQQSDPNAAFMQAEQMKAQTRAQVDMQKAAMEHQRKLLELASKDDLERDGMAQDLLVEAAKILGQYGTSVDVERIKAEQAAPRQMMPMVGGFGQ
jgi:hypothetical protein